MPRIYYRIVKGPAYFLIGQRLRIEPPCHFEHRPLQSSVFVGLSKFFCGHRDERPAGWWAAGGKFEEETGGQRAISGTRRSRKESVSPDRLDHLAEDNSCASGTCNEDGRWTYFSPSTTWRSDKSRR